MKLDRAIDQIAAIHDQLAKSEVYRGYRSLPVALTGVLALLGGLLQPWIVSAEAPAAFVAYWSVVAAASVCLVAAEITVEYFLRFGPSVRRMTLRTVAQFIPCLVAGAIVTLAMTAAAEEVIAFLPGIWAILFSLGILASRPYLPRATGWVAMFYLVGGCFLLHGATNGTSLEPSGMASVFGAGQLLAAVVLYWNLERADEP